MSARLIIIGVFAVIDRLRKRKNYASPDYNPRVAVIIPAYNEEKVIVRTIRSLIFPSVGAPGSSLMIGVSSRFGSVEGSARTTRIAPARRFSPQARGCGISHRRSRGLSPAGPCRMNTLTEGWARPSRDRNSAGLR